MTEGSNGAISHLAAKVNVLIVDDDPLTARLLGANLERRGGYATELVCQASRALRRVHEGGIDFVVSDLIMPEMDGIGLITELRKLPSPPPIVVLTANATVERAVEAVRAGAIDFIRKPVHTETLRLIIEKEIKRRPRPELRRDGVFLPFGLHLLEVEKRYIEAMLANRDYRALAKIADQLGISRKTLWKKRRRLDL